ncbi:MAG TPA: tripartite tricarboxylate transporter substrate binding protein [Burkholderiales bacterium]|nr:tripartite tricarboxylate transporter substrate binding protein [Burkholderiales bacterium]
MTRMLVAVLALVAATETLAQGAFPTRPVTLVVGFAPGGGTDIAARIVAKQLAVELGQQVLVENRAGAGGNIATGAVARAAPDGYLISLATISSLTVQPHLNSKLPYDPRRDLAPLTMGVVFANVLVVHPSVPATTVAEFVALAQAKPGTIGYGTSGIGTTGHLAGELFRMMAKAPIVHVPYKGGGPAMTDLLGGQIPSSFASAPSALPHVKAGKIRALATTGAARSSFLPDVPTIAESYPGYEATNWYAFVAPAKTPKDVVEQLNRQLVKVLSTPSVREQLLANGMEPQPSTPEELARYMEREYETWGRVVKEAGIQAE